MAGFKTDRFILISFLVLSFFQTVETLAQETDLLSKDFMETIPSALKKAVDISVSEQKRVRIIYLVPSDSTINAAYTLSLENAARHLQNWYQEQLGNNLTFQLNDPVVDIYQTPHESLWYANNPNGSLFTTFWNNVLQDGFMLTGGMFNDPDNIWIFYIDALNACGQCGGCGGSGCAVISANDLRGLVGLPWIPICPGEGRPYTPCRYVGGLGHELGHAFGVPHPPGCDDNEPGCDYNSIMWTGYTLYPECYFSEEEKTMLKNSAFIGEVQISACEFDCRYLQERYVFSDTVRVSICLGDSMLLGGSYRHDSGTYYDSLLTVCGCDSIIRTELEVNPSFTTEHQYAICSGDSILLAGDYRSENGIYYDSLLTGYGCDSVISSALALHPLPQPTLGRDTLISTQDTLLLDAGVEAVSYHWSNGSEEREVLLHSLGEGVHSYSVTVTDQNQCMNSDTILVQVIPAVYICIPGETNRVVGKLYPNPASDYIHLEMNRTGSHFFRIASGDGAVIMEGIFSGNQIRIDLSSFPKGVCLITIRSKDFVTTKKIIKL